MSPELLEELRARQMRVADADLEQLGTPIFVSQPWILPQAFMDPHDHAVVVQMRPPVRLDRSPQVRRPALEQELGHARKSRSFGDVRWQAIRESAHELVQTPLRGCTWGWALARTTSPRGSLRC